MCPSALSGFPACSWGRKSLYLGGGGGALDGEGCVLVESLQDSGAAAAHRRQAQLEDPTLEQLSLWLPKGRPPASILRTKHHSLQGRHHPVALW